jgi:hypothetical protein
MRRVLVTDDDGAVLRYFLVLLTQSQRYETMVLRICSRTVWAITTPCEFSVHKQGRRSKAASVRSGRLDQGSASLRSRQGVGAGEISVSAARAGFRESLRQTDGAPSPAANVGWCSPDHETLR